MAGGAYAGAGILALSLVAVPPDANSARVEVRAAQDNAALGSALGLSGGVSIPALVLSAALLAFVFGVLIPAGYLFGFIGYNIIDPILGVPNELAGSRASTVAVDESQSSATGYLIANTEDPAVASETNSVDVSPSAATAPNLFENLLSVVGPIILFGAIAVGLFVVAPAIFVYDSIAPRIGLPTFTEWQLSNAQTSTASVEPKATNTRVSTDDQDEGDSLPATVTATVTPDETPGDDTRLTDDPRQVTSTDSLTQAGQAASTELRNEQISMDTETLAGDPSEPAKPTPGSVTHLGNRGGSTAPAATAETSPPTSSTTGEDSPGGSASDGDADGS